MPINDVLGQLQAFLKSSTPLIETGSQSSEEPLRFTPGQQVQARVLSTLPNNRFLVLVDDRHLDLNLPRNTQPGNNVELRFVGNQPRPTFILANDQGQAARPAVNLSDTARFIGALLDRANQLSTRAETPLARSAPVLQGAPNNPLQFAGALRVALSQSGLFYESHQAQWVAGQRSLGELLKEPQALLSEARAFASAQRPAETQAQSAPTQPGGATTTGEPRPAATARADAPIAQPAQPPLGAEKTAELAAGARVVIERGERPAAEPVHPSAAPVVQQQLDVLDNRQVIWQGQIWPGQLMHWEIEERDAREGESTEPVPEWQTRLALSLPNLGELGAQLRFSAQGIRIELTAGNADTAQRLQAASGQLQAGFERADLNLVQFQVKVDG